MQARCRACAWPGNGIAQMVQLAEKKPPDACRQAAGALFADWSDNERFPLYAYYYPQTSRSGETRCGRCWSFRGGAGLNGDW